MKRYLSCLERFTRDLGFGWVSMIVTVVLLEDEVVDSAGECGGAIADGSDMLMRVMVVKEEQ